MVQYDQLYAYTKDYQLYRSLITMEFDFPTVKLENIYGNSSGIMTQDKESAGCHRTKS